MKNIKFNQLEKYEAEELYQNQARKGLEKAGVDGHLLNTLDDYIEGVEDIWNWYFYALDDAWDERVLRWLKTLSKRELEEGAMSEPFYRGERRWIEEPLSRLQNEWGWQSLAVELPNLTTELYTAYVYNKNQWMDRHPQVLDSKINKELEDSEEFFNSLEKKGIRLVA